MMPPRGFPLLGLRCDPHHPPLHYRHRWSHRHRQSRQTLHPPHPWAWRQLAWALIGPTRPSGATERGHKEVEKGPDDASSGFSNMYGTFRGPIPLHCPCGAPPGATMVQNNTLVHRRGLTRGRVVGRPPFRMDLSRGAPTPLALGDLRARGHSAASRHGIETG